MNTNLCRALQITAATLFCVNLGCSPSKEVAVEPNKTSLQPVTVQLNWFAEAEHGGFYAALVGKQYADAGLDVTINPGGKTASFLGELLLGRAQFVVTNAEDVVMFRNEGADVVAVMTACQHHPRCIMVRSDSGVKSLQDLSGLTLQVQAGRPYLAFLRKQGLLEGVTEVPYTGTVAQTIADPKFGQQAYIYSEPLLAREQGADVTTFMVSDLGFDPYSSVLVTTSQVIKEQPDLVRKMVAASIAGWEAYLKDPEPTNAFILQQNQQGITAAALTEGVAILKPMCLPADGEPGRLGEMTVARWQTLVSQMVDSGVVSAEKVKAEECFDLSFLNGTAPR